MKKKVIKLFGEDYLVSFPNVGQMIDIEQLKFALTGGRYVEFARSNLFNHLFILDFADAAAYFSVLIPELQKDMGNKNLTNMEAAQAKELIKAYKEQFLPWFKPMLDDLYEYNTQESTEVVKEADGNKETESTQE